MRIVIAKPQQKPYIAEVEDSLESYQSVVGGYLETVSFSNGLILVCNEEGKLQGLPPNARVGRDIIVGNFFVVGDGGEDFRSLTDEECQKVLEVLKWEK